ncbi:hypothetical protein [Campylobacter troglodytis]|nr:hypothetical protein [Campylobacter troglodytis]
MTNKEQIEKLKDYAELVWASYGYFHFVGKAFEIKATKQVGREKIRQ